MRRAASVCLVILFWAASARPCATLPRGAEERVRTKSEDALIVWDEAHHTEHFVREALFDTSAKAFGFLVPVPGRPVLAEADDGVFYFLRQATGTLENEGSPSSSKRGVRMTCLPGYLTMGRPLSSAPPVSVVEVRRVAGLDATVLAASDADALAHWLSDRGFELRDSVKRWIAVYVAKGWYVVAFRYERPAEPDVPLDQSVRQGSFTSRAVRITFATERPVYPYLEPDDVPSQPGRSLSLFVLSTAAMQGRLVDEGARPWDAQTIFSAKVDFSPAGSVTLSGVELPAPGWLSLFSDRTAKRPPSDLAFHALTSAKEILPPSLQGPVYIPVDLLLGAALVAVWIWRRGRRASRSIVP